MKHSSGLDAWYSSEVGRAVLAVEKQLCAGVLPMMFGYHLIQLGGSPNGILFNASRVNHCVQALPESGGGLICLYEQLPFDSDSADVVILHHTLELADNPHQVLREVNRILAPHGHVLVVSTNPMSLLGLLSRWSRYATSGYRIKRLISRRRLKDWLGLMDYELITTKLGYFALPVSIARIRELCNRWEQPSQRIGLPWGGVYLVVARKRIGALTPVRPQWALKPRLALPQMKPTLRGYRSRLKKGGDIV